jgi:cell wall-associated NlpC family hydrolase
VTFSQVCCGRAVSSSELAPGDLIFFRHNAHVGMSLGGGWFILTPHTGDVVKISSLASRSDVSACRRIL